MTLTRDWQVSAIVAARSGRHFAVDDGRGQRAERPGGQRPNKISDDVYVKDGLRWLNPAAFQAPAPGTFGNLENNSLVGPRRFNVDMGVIALVPLRWRRSRSSSELRCSTC